MSDFLENLLTRSFQPVKEIQPLAASLFAPALNAPRRLALAAEPFEDPFAEPSADDQLAQNADLLALRRVPLSGEETVSPVVGDQQRASVRETPPPQTAGPHAEAMAPSAKPVIEPVPFQAPLRTVPVMEDQPLFSDSETQVPGVVRPHATVTTPLAGPVIPPVASPPRIHETRPLLAAEPPQQPGQLAMANEAKPLPAETSPPVLARRAQQPAVDDNSIRPAFQPGVAAKALAPHQTQPLLGAEPLTPDPLAVANEIKPLPGETLPPVSARRAQPPAVDDDSLRPAFQPAMATRPLVPLAAPTQRPSAQREGAINAERNSSPSQKQTSLPTHDYLPASQPGTETITIERVTKIADTTAAIAEARMALVPKLIVTPPLVPNFKVRSAPQRQPVPNVQAPDALHPETVINVTIGRIEVRATPPAAPKPERQRSASLIMGLDEYLRQRSGGNGGNGGSR